MNPNEKRKQEVDDHVYFEARLILDRCSSAIEMISTKGLQSPTHIKLAQAAKKRIIRQIKRIR